MSLYVPLEFAGFALVLVVLILEFKNVILLQQYGTQLWTSITGQDLIADVDETRMRVRGGKKENPFAYTYRHKDFKGNEDVKIDPVSYNDKGCYTKWGGRAIKWYGPGRLLAKTPIRMLGQYECLQVAKKYKARSIEAKPDQKAYIERLQAAVKKLVKHYHRPKYDDAELDDIIEFNELFCRIAQGNEKTACDIMKAYGHSDNTELDRLCNKHILLPANTSSSPTQAAVAAAGQPAPAADGGVQVPAPANLMSMTRKELVEQLKYEVMMVCEYCKEVAMRPDYIPFAEMIKACPDMTSSIEIFGKVKQESKNEESKIDVSKYVMYCGATAVLTSVVWLVALWITSAH